MCMSFPYSRDVNPFETDVKGRIYVVETQRTLGQLKHNTPGVS